MNQKEISSTLREIKALKKNEDDTEGIEAVVVPFVENLYREKKFSTITQLFTDILDSNDPGYYEFETAYAFDQMREFGEAEGIYDFLLIWDENNTAILNNLSNIKKGKGDIDEAFELIKKAHELTKGKDEIVTRNYNTLLRIIAEKEEADHLFKTAKEALEKETKWALNKLEYFLLNVQKDVLFKDGCLPIPRWKFKVLMGVDEEKADSLRDQWLKKGYIRTRDVRADKGVLIYDINPNLKSYLKEAKPVELNSEWFAGIDNLNREKLQECDYFVIKEKIEKVSAKFRTILNRDYDELIFNYLLGNKKSTIILAGSFLELLFTYECEKKRLTSISYTVGAKIVKKDLLDCGLADFLSYFEEQKTFKPIIVSLGDVSRIYRNFIHPGNEIKNKEKLDNTKVELCFHSATQIAKYLLKSK